MTPDRKIVITGADGFIGRNLAIRLAEVGYHDVAKLTRGSSPAEFEAQIAGAEVVFHLAGANRPPSDDDFLKVNRDYTAQIIDVLKRGIASPLLIYSSSSKATDPTPYGSSKKAAEDLLSGYAADTGAAVAIYRLPNIFGKWARPNYNSAVATFCHNAARGIPIMVHDRSAPLQLLYVDDLIEQWLTLLRVDSPATGIVEPSDIYATTVGEVADLISGFAEDRLAGLVDAVGTGLRRALYATYIAALPPESFSYPLVAHTDPRGSFSEMLKTRSSGQFSYFTAHPGITRGGHYHHTKTEKFLIVHGDALFRFRNIVTDETHEVRTSGSEPVVVETIPGWAHDVTNVGEGEMISLLWANEIFDRARPDTIGAPV